MSRIKNSATTIVLTVLAAAGTAGAFVFTILAGEGGRGQVRNICLGVLCATVPVAAAPIGRYLSNRTIRTEISRREDAVAAAERALEYQREAEEKARKVEIAAQAQLIFALSGRLSPILYCLGRIAAGPGNGETSELLGRLTQAVVAAAASGPEGSTGRRAVFLKTRGTRMECAAYAGRDGQQDAARTVYERASSDPLGRFLFDLLDHEEVKNISDCDVPDEQGKFPVNRDYRTIILAAVVTGDLPHGVLTLDAPEPESLAASDAEIMKILANLLGVGLALGASRIRTELSIPEQTWPAYARNGSDMRVSNPSPE